MTQEERLRDLVLSDAWQRRCLEILRQVLPQGWVAAGFVRNLVWDDLGCLRGEDLADVDVVLFDAADISEAAEKVTEAGLAAMAADIPWSVKNQARMHLKHGDAPYRDLTDALGHWLETATTVSVRLREDGRLEILAPYGLDDLMAGLLRPTRSGFERLADLTRRAEEKGWLRRWPYVDFLADEPAMSLSPFKAIV